MRIMYHPPTLELLFARIERALARHLPLFVDFDPGPIDTRDVLQDLNRD